MAMAQLRIEQVGFSGEAFEFLANIGMRTVSEVLRLPRDGLAIDAGCGDGKWPVFVTRRGYRVIALDVAHEGGRRAPVAATPT